MSSPQSGAQENQVPNLDSLITKNKSNENNENNENQDLTNKNENDLFEELDRVFGSLSTPKNNEKKESLTHSRENPVKKEKEFQVTPTPRNSSSSSSTNENSTKSSSSDSKTFKENSSQILMNINTNTNPKTDYVIDFDTVKNDTVKNKEQNKQIDKKIEKTTEKEKQNEKEKQSDKEKEKRMQEYRTWFHDLREEPLMVFDKKYQYFPERSIDTQFKNLTNKARKNRWVPEDVLSKVAKDAESFAKESNKALKHTLGATFSFFAFADGAICDNLMENFMQTEGLSSWMQSFFAEQVSMERVHAETYAIFLETIIKDPKEVERLKTGFENLEAIKNMHDWIRKWMDPAIDFRLRTLAFLVVEGVFFCSSFCVISWLRAFKSGKFPGLELGNTLIARDESGHAEFGVTTMNAFVYKPPKEIVYEIFRSGVECSEKFVDFAIQPGLFDMSADKMKQFVRFTADRWLTQIGYPRLWNALTPFSWHTTLELEERSAQFERAPSYSLVEHS